MKTIKNVFALLKKKPAFPRKKVLVLEGGHTAHMEANGTPFPYIPQWMVIFMLLFMFSVDLYQNWWERKQVTEPVALHHRKK